MSESRFCVKIAFLKNTPRWQTAFAPIPKTLAFSVKLLCRLKYELFLVYKFGCVKRCDSKQRQEEKGWILMHNNLFRTQEQCGVEGVRES